MSTGQLGTACPHKQIDSSQSNYSLCGPPVLLMVLDLLFSGFRTTGRDSASEEIERTQSVKAVLVCLLSASLLA